MLNSWLKLSFLIVSFMFSLPADYQTIKSIILELKTSVIIIYEKKGFLKIKRFLLFSHKVEKQVSCNPHLTDGSINLILKDACVAESQSC